MPENHDNITPRDEEAAPAKPLKKPFFTRKRTIIFIVLTIIIGLCVWDFADPPLWWQLDAHENKRAMLKYTQENYPGAKITYQNYEFNKITILGNVSIDSISLEWNDVAFSILAQNGKVIRDNYWSGVSYKAIDEKFLKPFFEPQSIKADFEIYAPDLREFFRENPDSEITQFDETGTRTYIVIRPKKINGKETPQDLGWMYDFYCYWQENTTLPSYEVTLIYPPYPMTKKGAYFIHFTEYSDFQSEEEFYAAFVHDV